MRHSCPEALSPVQPRDRHSCSHLPRAVRTHRLRFGTRYRAATSPKPSATAKVQLHYVVLVLLEGGRQWKLAGRTELRSNNPCVRRDRWARAHDGEFGPGATNSNPL